MIIKYLAKKTWVKEIWEKRDQDTDVLIASSSQDGEYEALAFPIE